MAESIVSCPGCGKKFRIRDASTPGEFECSACQAVVSYGASGAAPPARPARAKPAGGGGGGRGGARGGHRGGGRGAPGRARGGARGGARGRRGSGRYGDEEGGPPPKSNAALYAILGVGGAVVVIGVVIAIVLSSGGDPVTPVAGTGGVTDSTGPGGGGTGMNEPARTSPLNTGDPAPLGGTPEVSQPSVPTATGGIGEVNQPSPADVPGGGGTAREVDRPDRSVGAADISKGGFYGKKWTNLRTLSYDKLAKDLDHFDDTPADLQAEIDKLCATLVDFYAGMDGNIAKKRLAEIGRPALPKVISAFLEVGDPGTREGMINTCMVDGTLRLIAGTPKRVYPSMTPMSNPSKEIIRKTAKSWYAWFYSEGYGIKTFDLGGEDEEEEEE